MALKSKSQPTRHAIPHEPDEWVEVVPISAGEWDSVSSDLTGVQWTLAVASKVVTSWSYNEELCADRLADLDMETFKWVDSNILEWAGIRAPSEKKDSTESSSATTDQGKDDSPASSGT